MSKILPTIYYAAFLAAFFLYGYNPQITYLFKKVEFIDGTNPLKPTIGTLTESTTISENLILASAANSRAEINHNGIILRIGSSTVFRLQKENSLWIKSGSILFSSDKNCSININSQNSSAQYRGYGTFIIEATSNGGFKFIPLESKGVITTKQGGKLDVQNGRLLLILDNPSVFGNTYDIDLSLLIKSSRLVNAFPDPLPRLQKIGLALYSQQLKMRGKYNALIGDATTNSNLQLWKLNNQSAIDTKNKPDSKKSDGFLKSIFLK